MSESKFSPLKECLASLEKDFEEQKTELEASQKACKALQGENEALRQKCKELELEKEDFEKKTSDLVEVMKFQASEDETQLQSLKELVIQYQKGQEKLKSEKEDLEKTLKRFKEIEKNQENKARFTVLNLMTRSTEMEGRLNTLSFLKTERDLQIRDLEKKIRHYETCVNQNSELYRDIIKAKEDLEDAQNKLNCENLSMRKINELQETIINELTIEDLSKDEVINELATQVAENHSKIEQLEVALGNAEIELNHLYPKLDHMRLRLEGIDGQLTTVMRSFFNRYHSLKDLLRLNFRIKVDGTLDERFCFTKEFICLSSIIQVNPVQSLFANA